MLSFGRIGEEELRHRIPLGEIVGAAFSFDKYFVWILKEIQQD